MSAKTPSTRRSEPFCWNCGVNPAGRQLLTIAEAAAYCGVSTHTIYRWMDDDKIEWVLTAGNKRRIFQDSLCASPPDGNRGKDKIRTGSKVTGRQEAL